MGASHFSGPVYSENGFVSTTGTSSFSGPVYSSNGFISTAGVPHAALTLNTATAATTLTAASVAGTADQNTSFVNINMTGTLAAGAAVTLPPAANLAAFQSAASGDTYMLRIINSSSGAFAWTVTTNTGWTLTGTMTVAQNTWRDFIVQFTSTTTATLTTVGVGTYS
jgi:hypothetical protein